MDNSGSKSSSGNCVLQSKRWFSAGRGHKFSQKTKRDFYGAPVYGWQPFILTKSSYKATGNDIRTRRLQTVSGSLPSIQISGCEMVL